MPAFSCCYCLSSLEKQLDFKPLPQVRQELSWFLEKRVFQVKLIDRTFNCRRDYALAIWRFLRQQDHGVTSFPFGRRDGKHPAGVTVWREKHAKNKKGVSYGMDL